jgi:hypothetical protein
VRVDAAPIQTVTYPNESAQSAIAHLDAIASAGGANVFVSELASDPHGEDYRKVTVDITRQDWRRIHPKLVAAGWSNFGEDSLAYSLPQQHYVIAQPSF